MLQSGSEVSFDSYLYESIQRREEMIERIIEDRGKLRGITATESTAFKPGQLFGQDDTVVDTSQLTVAGSLSATENEQRKCILKLIGEEEVEVRERQLQRRNDRQIEQIDLEIKLWRDQNVYFIDKCCKLNKSNNDS